MVSCVASSHQAAFLKRRSIFDSIGLVFEGTQLLKNKFKDDNLGIKLDITKVFDTVHWNFLMQVL